MLVEETGIAGFTSVLAKGALPMNYPLYMGVYVGAASPSRIRERVEQADLIINVGSFLRYSFAGCDPMPKHRFWREAVEKPKGNQAQQKCQGSVE
jgi:thiamine pyrophosphate-dependent acetolactate synthase large subunit-like protein